jgi:gliding motility-associated-like protein
MFLISRILKSLLAPPSRGAYFIISFLYSTHCTAQDSTLKSLPVLHMGAEFHFCPTTNFTLAPDSITGGIAPFQYRWEKVGILVGTEPTLQLNLTDTTSIQLVIMDAAGKMASHSLLLYPHTPIDASFEVNAWEGCVPVNVVFSSNFVAFQHVSEMNWFYGNGDTDRQLASASQTYEDAGLFTPSLSITDVYGCVWSDTLDIGIRAFPTPTASFRINSDKLYLPETSLPLENTSIGADSFIWQYEGALPISDFEPTIEFPANLEKNYTLRLTARNAFGCNATAEKSIEVVQAIELYLPNAFTPDGDGINDTWEINGLGINAYHVRLEIYDPWGTIVFSTSDPNEAWTGYSADGVTPLNSGNYSYRIIARDNEYGVGHLFEGHVILLR